MGKATVLIPATEYAIERGLSRERVVRAIQKGEIPGSCIAGRWLVEKDAASRGQRERTDESKQKAR